MLVLCEKKKNKSYEVHFCFVYILMSVGYINQSGGPHDSWFSVKFNLIKHA